MFVRSILEQFCVVWHSTLNNEDSDNLERVQKSAIKIILHEDYTDYTDGLFRLNIEILSEQRNTLCKNFAKETIKHEKLTNMFPKNEIIPDMETRTHETIKVNMAFTERYKSSAIPQMQRLLNKSFTDEEYEEA